MASVLVVDDDAHEQREIARALEPYGHRIVFGAAEGGGPIDVIVYGKSEESAFELHAQLKRGESAPALILRSRAPTSALAMRADEAGIEQLLAHAAPHALLLFAVQRAVKRRRALLPAEAPPGANGLDPFIGRSAAIRELEALARRVAEVDSPILLLGETGAGKGALAAWLHRNGPRQRSAFVDLNCAGLSKDLLEAELFGHERGAFTGAVAVKPGLLETAHRGTLLLDEIGDIELPVQPRILKVLEEKRFRRLGELRDRTVDVRLIAATRQDLVGLVEQQRFRSDLYFRINTIPITVPPLRARAEDIPLIAARLLAEIGARLKRGPFGITRAAERRLCEYSWPGNIRELRNILERATLLCEDDAIGPDGLLFAGVREAAPPSCIDTNVTLCEMERRHIVRVMEEEDLRVERAALRLGLPRSSLYQKLKRYGIPNSRDSGRVA